MKSKKTSKTPAQVMAAFFLVGISFSLLLAFSCAYQKCAQVVGEPPVLEGVIHTVSEGETLTGIGRAYGVTPQRLQRINNIHDPNLLRVGQRLFIPGATEVKTAVVVQAAAPREKGVYHVVKPGETLWRISQAYGVDSRTLERYNRIHNPRTLQVGQRLFIPGAEEVKEVKMRVAERVYHKASGSREERIALAKRIESIVERYRAEKSETAVLDTEPVSALPPPPPAGEQSPTPTPTPTPGADAKGFNPPAKMKRAGSIELSWPLAEKFSIVKDFGVGTGLISKGVFLAAPAGTPVLAAADGEVQLVGNVNDDFGDAYGNYVILYHGKYKGKGLRTIYGHNSKILVKPGDKVQRGQPIARVGRTGRSYNVATDHVHFEIRKAADPVNPLQFLPSLP